MTGRRWSCIAPLVLAAASGSRGVQSTQTSDPPLHAPTDAFAHQLDETIPGMLERNRVNGAGVALIRGGRVVLLRGYGYADREHGVPATSATVFNVGSISKTVTAWGVLHLVERGRISLDDPVDRYLRRWHLPSAAWSTDGVTVRRLLSHTAGVSLPSVHEYGGAETLPSLPVALASSPDAVQVSTQPGTAFSYSGGGYEILQLLVEDVTGRPFADYMRDDVLLPLGMTHSTFDPTRVNAARLAVPYDSGHVTPRRRYVGLAAAGLYSTAEDLARFVAAGMRDDSGQLPGRGVLSPTTVQLMYTPAPASASGFGFHYGLGYNLFPLGSDYGPLKILGDGALAPGHMGQNTGWGAVIWSVPWTGDGFVMLTNSSSGYEAYRWPLCDWVRWIAIPSFGYLCNGRDAQPAGPMGTALYAPDRREAKGPRLAFIDTIARALTSDSAPGLAILVSEHGVIRHAAGYGIADLATGRSVTQDTPFYLASLAKQFTAVEIMRLVRDGRIRYGDPARRYLPELGALDDRVTIATLLTHSSGVPDYYTFIRDWSHVASLTNRAVLDTLRGKPLEFVPGSRSHYSNSGYVLLASIIERVTGQPFARAMQRDLFVPAGMSATLVLDDSATFPALRAVGYDTAGGHFRLSDYGVFELASGARVYSTIRTVGAGGMYSTLRDLGTWTEKLFSGAVIDSALVATAISPIVPAPDERGIDRVLGYGYGWVASRRNSEEVIWHDGGFAGFRTIIARVPRRDVTVIVLSNSALVKQHDVALAVLDELATRNRLQ